MRDYGNITELVSVSFRKNTQVVQLKPNVATTYVTTTVTELPPDAAASVVLVGQASTQTLTNKSISGSSNTLTNLPASALTGTVSPASGGTGIANNAANTLTFTGNFSLGLTLTGNTSVTLPVTGTLSTLAGAETLSNKTLTSPQINSGTLATPAVTGASDWTVTSAPSTPAASHLALYASSVDGKFHVKDSAGTDSVLGASGSGELNLVANPSDAAGWTAATGASLVTTTSAGDLPLGSAVPTAIKITSGTGASSEATLAQTNSYSFTTPASYAVKTKVEFWLRPGANFLANEWTVSVYAGSTRQSLTTDASGVTYVPNYGGKFTTYFDAAASTGYTARVTRTVNAGTNAGVLNLANVIVGPGIQPQGAVVGPWLSFTPVASGLGAGGLSSSSTDGWYRRVGDSMEVKMRVLKDGTPGSGSANVFVDIPSGLTVNTSALPTTLQVGFVTFATATYAGASSVSIAGNQFYFQKTGSGTNIKGSDMSAGSELDIAGLMIPISEWAGSGTINLAQNDVEYAYNTSTSDASDTTSFGYGPGGTTVVGPLTSTRSKRVRFKSPIQSGDSLIVEVQAAGGGQWNPVASGDPSTGIGGLTFQTSSFTYGIGISTTYVNATDVDVSFGKYQYSSGATYASAGTAWATSTANWRVRKISGGQAVGFGAFQAASTANPAGISGLVPAAGLPGRTDGNAIAAGYVGEVLTANATGVSVTNTTTNVTSKALPAGTWLISAAVDQNGGSAGGWINCGISVNSASTTGTVEGRDLFFGATNAGIGTASVPMKLVTLSATTTYYCVSAIGSGTGTVNGMITAVRIA